MCFCSQVHLDTDFPMDNSVQDVVVHFWLQNSMISNAELAHISNVSRIWREAAKKSVLRQGMKTNNENVNGKSEKLRLLLLPSMVRCMVRSESNSSSEPSSCCINETISGETFCATWLHPKGIQERQISLNADDDDDDDMEFSHHSAFAYEEESADEDRSRCSRKQQQRRKQRSKSPSALMRQAPTQLLEDVVSTCDEWRGYRTAMDVLQHFGYTAHFVEDVLNSAARDFLLLQKCKTNGETQRSSTTRKSPTTATFAVRGAAIARPESYCFCVDREIDELKVFRERVEDGDDEYVDIRTQERKHKLIRRERRRRELQRDVLPRVITRTPLLQSGEQYDRRCVQFLNASGSHAVCMTTPRFACGPVPEPVTILCVGIATEDGCFLSGLHHRFELGHLYPHDKVAEVTELSQVCIATEAWGIEAGILQQIRMAVL